MPNRLPQNKQISTHASSAQQAIKRLQRDSSWSLRWRFPIKIKFWIITLLKREINQQLLKPGEILQIDKGIPSQYDLTLEELHQKETKSKKWPALTRQPATAAKPPLSNKPVRLRPESATRPPQQTNNLEPPWQPKLEPLGLPHSDTEWNHCNRNNANQNNPNNANYQRHGSQ
jgi:hypothetical protein